MTLAIIDADVVAYRAASAMADTPDWGEGSTRVPLDASVAADAACQTLETWAKIAKCSELVACFTGRENFRKRILASYKHTRAGKVKPQSYAHVVETVRARFATRLVDGLEGDDLMGIMLTNPKHHDAVCLTVDKDLKGVPGLHMNPLKDAAPALVGLKEADYFWMTQALTGDPVDGYTGIPRIGPKKALEILGARPALVSYLWPAVVAAYVRHKLTEADALTQARCARILRRGDYDRKTQEILLWSPTTPLRIPVRDPSK